MSAGQRLCQSRWLLCVWRGCLVLELGLVGRRGGCWVLVSCLLDHVSV